MRECLAWCWRWSSVLVVALAATAVTVYPPYTYWPPIRSDGAGYHIWNYAILKGDVSFSWFQGEPADVALHQPDPAVPRYSCKYPPGVAFLRLPVMALFTDTSRNGPPFSPAEHWACLALAAAALVVTVVLGLDTCCRLEVPAVWANVSVLVLTFGTGLFHCASFDAGYSHIYSAMLAAALIWLAVRATQLQRSIPVLPVVALAALLFLVRTTNVVLLGSWVVACVVAGRSRGFRLRAVGACAVGLFVGAAVTLAINVQMFGRPTLHTYPGEEFLWNDPRQFLVLFGKDQGLLCSHPVVGVALVCALIARQTRGAGLLVLAVFGAYTVLYGYWWTWHLGNGFGHRGFVEAVPFVIPLFAKALASLPRGVKIACAGLALGAAAYTFGLMCLYWGSRAAGRYLLA